MSVSQARAKLPKKRRRVLPVEAVRPKNPVLGMGAPQGRRGGVVGDTGTGVTRRMNAIKHNHPGALENKLNRIGNIT